MTTLTPRQDFRQSDFVKGWADLVSSKQFEAAAKTAMLEYQSAVMTGLQPAENAFRLHGAQQFLQVLMSLADSETVPTRPNNSLDYHH